MIFICYLGICCCFFFSQQNDFINRFISFWFYHKSIESMLSDVAQNENEQPAIWYQSKEIKKTELKIRKIQLKSIHVEQPWAMSRTELKISQKKRKNKIQRNCRKSELLFDISCARVLWHFNMHSMRSTFWCYFSPYFCAFVLLSLAYSKQASQSIFVYVRIV